MPTIDYLIMLDIAEIVRAWKWNDLTEREAIAKIQVILKNNA